MAALRARQRKAKRGRPKKNRFLVRDKWPRVYRLMVHGRERFMVDSRRVGFRESKRSFYPTVEEAIRSAETLEIELLNHGRSAFGELSALERKDAREALQILAEFSGATLLAAAQAYARSRRAEREAASVPSLKDALSLYLASKRAQHASGTFATLSLYDLESKTRHLLVELGERRLSEIDEGTMEEFLSSLSLSPRTRENVRLKSSQFFNFCLRRKWITANPATGLGRKIERKEVEILSVEEARALFARAYSSPAAHAIVPYLAVSLFAGLRPGEAAQLKWEQIHFETGQIEVLRSTSKTRETRFVTLEPILAEWLLPFRCVSGPITQMGFKRDWRTWRKSAGYNPKTNPWPVDVLRHTFGSYWLAVHQDRAHLAEVMGNSVNIIKRYYRRAIPLGKAEAFWQLSPPHSSGDNVLQFRQAG
jgi:integrase